MRGHFPSRARRAQSAGRCKPFSLCRYASSCRSITGRPVLPDGASSDFLQPFSQRLRRRAWLSRHARYSTHARRRTLTVARPSLATNPLRVSPLPDVAAEIALLECPPLACCTPHRSR